MASFKTMTQLMQLKNIYSTKAVLVLIDHPVIGIVFVAGNTQHI